MRHVVIALLAAFNLGAQEPASRNAAAETIRAYLADCARFGFSGSVLAARNGAVVLAEGCGLADRGAKVRNTKDTLYEIASATKPFTAVAILQLEVDGKLSTDDPIGKHLPGVPAGFEGVTIGHLLTHTSGMPRSAGGGAGDDLARAVAGYLANGPTRAPGATYEYWNGGYALLAGIVEHVSAQSYMDFCRKRIFAPATMSSSGFTGDALEVARVAIGYEPDAAPRRATEHPYNDSYGWHYRGMGGLVTSVEDLYRFDRALRDDTLLSAAARRKLATPLRDGYACGFQVDARARRKVGHGGSVRGFHCQFSRFPEQDACVIVLCNGRVIPPFIIEDGVTASLFGDAPRQPRPPRTTAWPAAKLEEVAGSYESKPGERVVARVVDESIVLQAEGPTMLRELAASASGAVPEEPDAKLVESAATIVRGLSASDVALLRASMAPGIPASWPDVVRTKLWPARIEGLGALRDVRVAGALRTSQSTTVLVACDFANGPVRIKVVFRGDRLQIFDLHGPDALAEAFAAPAPDGRLLRFHWQGKQPAPIAIVRDASGRPTALRFVTSGGDAVYKRVTAK